MRVVLSGTEDERARLLKVLEDAGIDADIVMASAPEPLEKLTAREQEVLDLLAGGLTNKAIAARLEISEHTVKFHVAAICAKLGAENRTDAVRIGVRQGLVVL